MDVYRFYLGARGRPRVPRNSIEAKLGSGRRDARLTGRRRTGCRPSSLHPSELRTAHVATADSRQEPSMDSDLYLHNSQFYAAVIQRSTSLQLSRNTNIENVSIWRLDRCLGLYCEKVFFKVPHRELGIVSQVSLN
ncbi:unnamed protein product [Leptidea sinapis]|uniref:Uncharacterized protein n=1 Tax=Leptidea sinapis TaxID=189913 RepID=A0A5E4Q863_9NEOP|nr:unnamed protein product [Leptidea sinapis]